MFLILREQPEATRYRDPIPIYEDKAFPIQKSLVMIIWKPIGMRSRYGHKREYLLVSTATTDLIHKAKGSRQHHGHDWESLKSVGLSKTHKSYLVTGSR